jgi:UPF0755 protein
MLDIMKPISIFLKLFFSLLLLFGLLILSLGWVSSCYFHALGQKSFPVEETLVEIPYGSSVRRVAEILAENNVISAPRKFYWYVRLGRSDGTKFQAGYYSFLGDLTYNQIADRLLLGRDQSFKVTFKEGQTLVDLAMLLEDAGLTTKEQFAAAMTNDEILQLINPILSFRRQHLVNDMGGIEGYLFPDTYFFAKHDTPETIIKKMYRRLEVQLDDHLRARIKETNTSLHEILTLASIIEKETGSPKERPLISSVYRNRLKVGMRLQADPTVIYGIKNYDGKIRKADLLTYHPYNTYVIAGLPPGPIASPGIDAIRAALWPEDTKYFYFVSKNDGSHVFCEDINCHNNAVRKWQIEYFKNAAK